MVQGVLLREDQTRIAKKCLVMVERFCVRADKSDVTLETGLQKTDVKQVTDLIDFSFHEKSTKCNRISMPLLQFP